MIAVIAPDGTLLGLFTSQVDAHLVAKPVGGTMWRCRPNSQECSVVASRVQARAVWWAGSSDRVLYRCGVPGWRALHCGRCRPAERHARLCALGARAVESKELVLQYTYNYTAIIMNE